jgi:hypothetical protein
VVVSVAAGGAAPSGYSINLERGLSVRAITVDVHARAVVAGVAGSRAFVRKLSADGGKPVFTTLLGGRTGNRDANTEAAAVAVDRSGNVYVTGRTTSHNFRTTSGTFQASDALAQSHSAVFVVKLDAESGAIVYSAILSGGVGRGIGVDFAGRAWVAGSTTDPRMFTSPDAFQSTPSGTESAFLMALGADGRHVLYSTYIGGAGGANAARALAVDTGGNVYVVGTTGSSAFPVRRALQGKAKTSAQCASGSAKAFAMKFGADHQVAYSTLLAGSCDDEATSVATDLAGDAFVTGWTSSSDFPCRHGFQCGVARPPAAFVTKIAADGKSLSYSFLLNGTRGESRATGIAVSQGRAWVAGWTTSEDFPMQGGLAGQSEASAAGARDLFVVQVAEDGTSLLTSGALAGNDAAEATAIAVDPSGEIYVTGAARRSFVTKLATGTSRVTSRSTAPGGTAGDARNGRPFPQP